MSELIKHTIHTVFEAELSSLLIDVTSASSRRNRARVRISQVSMMKIVQNVHIYTYLYIYILYTVEFPQIELFFRIK